MQEHEFKLKPSKQYLITLAIIVMVSVLVMIFMPLEWRVKCLGFILLTLYSVHILLHFGLLRSKKAIISLQRSADDKWLIQTNQGAYVVVLRGDSTVTSWVSVLRFQTAKRFQLFSCVIFRDSLLDVGLYRDLLVTLAL